ncbi:hypothetical protein [Alkalicoccobacillus plakortidis]|uniref:YokE-like PH domain-containing protein n=1 Tax=Alkalicoccobacillus plakortidis TaxID=444060 RepID=A0ABT0XI59_9BACI|nr:hypothetical protein [Alkalicoccobacillus plakortidis]MCM2675588.1 hypothetical protein [Alkalicoccobacillus plakortidis]
MENKNLIEEYLDLIYPDGIFTEHEYDLMMTNFKKFLEDKDDYIFFPKDYKEDINHHILYFFGRDKMIRVNFDMNMNVTLKFKDLSEMKVESLTIQKNAKRVLDLKFSDGMLVRLEEKQDNYKISSLIEKSLDALIKRLEL